VVDDTELVLFGALARQGDHRPPTQ
jgi:hypothetical protein